MNNNVVAIPLVKPRELNQGSTSTTETAFTSDGTIPVILPLPTALIGTHQTTWAANNNPGGQQMSIRFKVLACGRVTTGGAINVTVKLYAGVSATLGSDTAIATTGAVSVSTVSRNWQIEATLIWDSTSKRIDGWYAASLNGTVVANTVITNAVTGVDPVTQATTTGVPPYGFVVSGTFGTGSASNAMYLDYFVLMLA